MNSDAPETGRMSLHCGQHPDRKARAGCVDCTVGLCATCITRRDDGLARCSNCADPERESQNRPSESVFQPGDTTEESSSADGSDGRDSDSFQAESIRWIPWEYVARNNARTFIATVMGALTQPIRYMQCIDYRRTDIKTPLIFALLVGVLGQLAESARQLANPERLQALLDQMPELEGMSASTFVLTSLPILPLKVCIFLFLKGWLAHALLKAMSAEQSNFSTTFRVFAYAEAAAVMLWLPAIGPYAYKFLSVFLLLTGLRVAHNAGLSTALLVLMPTILLQSLGG